MLAPIITPAADSHYAPVPRFNVFSTARRYTSGGVAQWLAEFVDERS